MSAPRPNNRRIEKELRLLIENPEVKSYFHYESSGYENDDPNRPFLIYGYVLPQTFPYNYGSFKVKIKLPREYPFRMSELIFLTRIYHTEIHDCGGELMIYCCADCAQWSPRITLDKWIERAVNIIDGIDSTLSSRGLNCEAVKQCQQNSNEYWTTVMNMIDKYAYRRSNESIISLKFTAKRIIRTQLGFDSTKINQLPLSEILKEYLHLPFDRK